MSGHAAVLIGDLVRSSDASAESIDSTLALIADTATKAEHWTGGATRFTRFRGDGWQLLVRTPFYALRLAVIIAARLRGTPGALPSRIAIGIGTVEHEGGRDLSDAAGTAFEHSGRALDAMGRLPLFALSGDKLRPLHHAVRILLDERLRRWTREQAEATALYLDPDTPTLETIGNTLGITPQAVSARLNGAGAGALRRALVNWEDDEELLGHRDG